MQDGYYLLSEGDTFVAFEQERGCRFNEARFPSRDNAREYLLELHAAQARNKF